MNRLLGISLLVFGILSTRTGENYIYCDELDRFKPIILKNSLDVVPYILRKILCVRRKSSNVKATKKYIENNLKSRDSANKYVSDKEIDESESVLYLYFNDNQISNPFYFPKGFTNTKNVLIDFKVI